MAKKKAAAKKNGAAKSTLGSKGEFVRSLPSDMAVKDVLAKAKEQGMTLTDAYVYKARKKTTLGTTKRATVKPPALASSAPAASTAATGSIQHFVRSLPADTSATEAVAQAKAAGLKLSTGYFYTLKSSLGLSKAVGKRARSTKSKAVVAAPKAKAASSAINTVKITADDPQERAILEAMRVLGVARARSVIESAAKYFPA